jgi:RHS repeat-associated protein
MAMCATYLTMNGMIVHENRGDVQRDYVPDTLGSTAALVDNTQTLTDTWQYWPFGEVSQRTGTNSTRFTYVGTRGYLNDLPDKLYYVRFRCFLTSLARWISLDYLWPAEPAYTYSSNAPQQFVDPAGMSDGIVIPITRPVGISQAEWDAIIAYLEALGYSVVEITAILGALVLLVLALGFTCAAFKRLRYEICPYEGKGDTGIRKCKEGDGCLGTMIRSEEWGKCAVIQLMLSALCFRGDHSHDRILNAYIQNFLQCSMLIPSELRPGGVHKTPYRILMASLAQDELTNFIIESFRNREPPVKLLKGPIAGNELPPGHEGYGKGEPIPNNETDSVFRSIAGRSWQDVEADKLEWLMFYLSPEALAYYLPAILVYNVKHGYCIENVMSVLGRERFQRSTDMRDDLAKLLTQGERLAVAAYMESDTRNAYSPADVLFWKVGVLEWSTD